MVQDFIGAGYRWILGGAVLARQLLPWALFAVFAAAVLWLAFRKFDPEGQSTAAPSLKTAGRRMLQFIAAALTTAVLCGTLVEAGKMIEVRRLTIQEAAASRRREPNLSGVVQYAPVVAVIEDKTYTRTLTLPPDFATRVGAEGLQVLSPYLQDPSSENVLKLVDSFRRSGQDVVFTRELTRRDEVPVPADGADIKIDFRDQGAPSGRRHYQAEFTGEYRFKNPRDVQASMRFAFDLPQGGGTVQGFFIEVRGARVTEPDEHGLYSWLGDIAPGDQVIARVHYTVTGAAQFDYKLGSERRRIGDFHLVSTSSQPPRFSKSGIYPTQMEGSRAEWRLADVLTAQSISLVFPRADLQSQLLDKTTSILPGALFLFALAAFWLAPRKAFWAIAAFGVGLLATPILSSYVTPVATTVVGATLAALAGGLALGSARGWIAAILAAASTTVFLSVEHGGLLAWALAAVALIAVVWSDRRKPQPSEISS